MKVYVVTTQIGTWSKKSLVSVPIVDNTLFKSKSAAYREAVLSKNWFLKEGYELYYRQVQVERDEELREHMARLVLVKRETDQWAVIEVNNFVVL